MDELRQLTTATEDLAQLIIPITVEHLVSLVNYHVLESTKRQVVGTVHKVDEPTRRGNQNVAAKRQLIDLVSNGASAVNDTRPQHAAVAELSGLHKDLDGQLTSRADDTHQGFSANDGIEARTILGRVGTRRSQLLGFAHQFVQDGDQIGSRLARA